MLQEVIPAQTLDENFADLMTSGDPEKFKMVNETLVTKVWCSYRDQWRIAVQITQRESVMQKYHDEGYDYSGVKQTLIGVRRRFAWLGMAKDVKDYVATGVVCSMCEPGNPRSRR